MKENLKKIEVCMSNSACYLCLFLALFWSSYPSAQQADVAGQDHPLISRFSDTHISFYFESDYDEFMVATGKLESKAPKDRLPPVVRHEGRVTTIEYYANQKSYSVLQIYKNYESAFKRLGLESLFVCANDQECGHKFITQLYWYGDKKRQSKYRMFDGPNFNGVNTEYRYWSGRGVIEGKSYYVSLAVARKFTFPVVVMLDINEIDTLDTERIEIDLDALTESIAAEGKVVLSGLLFDTNKSVLKQDSLSVLEVVVSYLRDNPQKQFYVVGHTDSDGDYPSNLKLSSSRAATVVDILISRYGIEGQRLKAVGVGPVSPRTKNGTDEQKAKNRRVELVEMAP